MEETYTKKFKAIDTLLFIVLGMGFYLQYRYNLFLDDDYLYSTYTWTDHPITSVKEALASQVVAYMECNGRFLIHTIVHLFCGIWGPSAFAIVDTFMFLFFFWFMIKLTMTGKKNFYLKTFILLALIWFFVPVQGVAFLGNIAFSVNYLWASVANLGFIIAYRKSKTDAAQWWRLALLMLLGILVGSLQESFSVGIAGALFIYYCFHLKELKGQRLFLVLGYFLGALIIIGAPGNFIRMQGEQDPLINSGLKLLILTKWSYFRSILRYVPILAVLAVTLLLMYVRDKSAAIEFMRKNQIYLTAIVINVLFAVVIAYKGPWQIISSALFAIIILAKLIFGQLENLSRKCRLIILSVTGIFMISTYFYALRIRQELFAEHEALVEAARETKSGIIWADYEVSGRIIQRKHHLISNYFRVVFYMGDDCHKHLLSTYLTKGENPELVKCVLPFSPEKIRSFCTADNRLGSSLQIFKAGKNPFIIVVANSAAEMRQTMTELNRIQINPVRTLALGSLGCEEFMYKGIYYAVIFNNSFADTA